MPLRRSTTLIFAGWLSIQTALAQPAGNLTPAAPDLPQLLLSLTVVIGLIVGGAWVVKRFQLVGQPNTGGLRVVASLPLGPKERLLLVEAGERRLLLGVSAAGIVALDVENQPGQEQVGGADFSQQLDSEVRRWAAGS